MSQCTKNRIAMRKDIVFRFRIEYPVKYQNYFRLCWGRISWYENDDTRGRLYFIETILDKCESLNILLCRLLQSLLINFHTSTNEFFQATVIKFCKIKYLALLYTGQKHMSKSCLGIKCCHFRIEIAWFLVYHFRFLHPITITYSPCH